MITEYDLAIYKVQPNQLKMIQNTKNSNGGKSTRSKPIILTYIRVTRRYGDNPKFICGCGGGEC